MDRSPGGMKRHLAKQDSQKDVREQRFTAMANALIIPVRIKNAMVPMEKPDSRRRETRFEKVNKGLDGAADRAGDAVRELGGAFAPPPSPPVEDLRATRDFADPALRSQRRQAPQSTAFSHRYGRRFHSCSREKIVEEGERGLTFFILVSGTAEVFKHSSPGKLATLKAGSSFAVSFGEASLGPGAPPRNATIVCSSDLAELLVLHKADYDQIMKDYQKSEHRKAFKCMKRIPLFRHWAEPPRPALRRRLREADEPLAQRKRSWVTKKVTETVNVRLLELDSGSYFGEKGILENTTRAATVAALVDSTIVSLDKVAFLELLQRGHATSKGANKYAGANMGYPTEDEIISVISAIQDPAAAARANHEEVGVQAQIDNDTNGGMADDLDGEGEPTEKNDGDESSGARPPPGLDEHLLDVICEHNMVEYNRKLLEKERAKAKLAILNDPNYVPDRGTGHVLHQPEMHYTQQHRDTSHDDVG
ncbi:cGMP-dependent protein kinase [Aureococcus anophagefferens]|nr:cGMP-dependent protein kinase [Aureococcus anophagefferens]